MEGTADMDRLYELYKRHIDRLLVDVTAVNRTLGSSTPEKTGLQPLNRTEFEVFLEQPTDDPEAIQLWVRRFIDGHEREFLGLMVANKSVRVIDVDPNDDETHQGHRSTGT